VHGWLGTEAVVEAAPSLSATVRTIFPAAHRLDLWRVEAGEVAPGFVALIALGLVYFTIGHLRFARRDA
jgi:hypothetical protein